MGGTQGPEDHDVLHASQPAGGAFCHTLSGGGPAALVEPRGRHQNCLREWREPEAAGVEPGPATSPLRLTAHDFRPKRLTLRRLPTTDRVLGGPQEPSDVIPSPGETVETAGHSSQRLRPWPAEWRLSCDRTSMVASGLVPSPTYSRTHPRSCPSRPSGFDSGPFGTFAQG